MFYCGERYGLEIDANLMRIERFGVHCDWTPSEAGFSAVARWAKDLSGWFDSLLDQT